jgi:hypothetical protein
MAASGKLLYSTAGHLIYGRSGKLLYADRYLSEAIPGGGYIIDQYPQHIYRTGNGSGSSYAAAWAATRSSYDSNSWSFGDLEGANHGWIQCDPGNTLSYPTYRASLVLFGIAIPGAKWDRGTVDRLYGYVSQCSYGADQAGYEVVIGQLDDLDDLPDSIAALEAFGDRVVSLVESDRLSDLDVAVADYVVDSAWIVVLARSAAATPISAFGAGGTSAGGDFRINAPNGPLLRCAWPLKS